MLRSVLHTTVEAYIFAFQALRPSGKFLLSYLFTVILLLFLALSGVLESTHSVLSLVFLIIFIFVVYLVGCAYQAKLYSLALGNPKRSITVKGIRNIALASLFVSFILILALSIILVFLLVWPSTVLTLLCGDGSFACSSTGEDIQSNLLTVLKQPGGLLIWLPSLLLLAGFTLMTLRLSNYGIATIALDRVSVLSSLRYTKKTWGQIGLTGVFTYVIPSAICLVIQYIINSTTEADSVLSILLVLTSIAIYAPIVTGAVIYTVSSYFKQRGLYR